MKRKKSLIDAISRFVQLFILQQSYERGDFGKSYSMMIFMSVHVLQMKDTARQGDGGRNFVN